MQAKYTHDFTTKTRQLTLKLTAEDLEGLPETVAQEFRRAEHTLRVAQLITAWGRIIGLRPADPQADLFETAGVGEGGDDEPR